MYKMAYQTVSIDNLASTIVQELQNYSDEVAEAIKDDVREVAKECVEDIKENSPVKSGDYKKGWKSKVTFESRENIRITVYNSKKPQLAHLLEYGHESNLMDGRVEGKAHIRPAELKAEKELTRRVEEAVK